MEDAGGTEYLVARSSFFDKNFLKNVESQCIAVLRFLFTISPVVIIFFNA